MLILLQNEFWRKKKEGEEGFLRVKHFSTLKCPHKKKERIVPLFFYFRYCVLYLGLYLRISSFSVLALSSILSGVKS